MNFHLGLSFFNPNSYICFKTRIIDFLYHIDIALFHFINDTLSNSFFDWIMPHVRNKYTWFPFYTLIFILLVYKYKFKGLAIAIFAAGSIGLGDVISSHIFKPLFERARPCHLADFTSHLNLLLEHFPRSFSFTSSHATNHFALASFFSFLYYKKYKWMTPLLYLWASAICFAQVYVGVHFPLDVLMGACLGVLIGFSCHFLCKKSLKL